MKYILFFLALFIFVTPAFAEDGVDQEVSDREQTVLKREVEAPLNDAQIFEKQMLARRDAKPKRAKSKKVSGTRGTRTAKKSSSSSSSSISLTSGMYVK